MGRKQGHARELADLVERPVKDYDPEADVVPSESDHSGDDSSDNEPLGTEHYVTVGKSKLRHHEPLSLGPQYRGTRVSREALEADDDEAEDDEEASDVDEDDDDEDDDDEDDDDGDASSHHEDARVKQLRHTSRDLVKKTKHAKRPTATDFMGSDDEDEIDEDDEDDDLSDGSEIEGFIDDEAEEGSDDDEPAFSDEEEEENELSNDGNDEDQDEDEDENGQDPRAAGHKKSKSLNGSGIVASVKEMMGEQSVVKSLLRTVDADVQKGRAVQRQRKSFDALLNIRIRLQKSIVAVNSLEYADQVEEQTPEPYEAAEKSALQLWNALDEFRTTIHKGKKRKHTETDDTSTAALWDRMALHEKHQAARRKQVLEKWSRDAKKTSITASLAHKFSSNAERPITAMLSAEMDAPERLIKRTRTPRSCAPYHVAQKINEDNSIYDDADFYQLLLKELVDQRSGDGSGPGLQAATIRYAAVKEAKAKRHVDTKASKGRKMRFTPMPKLQNFMASEDRRSWEQSAIDRFFGTLFGQKLVLDEEVSDEEMGGVSMEDGGLRLFRS